MKRLNAKAPRKLSGGGVVEVWVQFFRFRESLPLYDSRNSVVEGSHGQSNDRAKNRANGTSYSATRLPVFHRSTALDRNVVASRQNWPTVVLSFPPRREKHGTWRESLRFVTRNQSIHGNERFHRSRASCSKDSISSA